MTAGIPPLVRGEYVSLCSLQLHVDRRLLLMDSSVSDFCRVTAPRSQGISENTHVPAHQAICAEWTLTNQRSETAPAVFKASPQLLKVDKKIKVFSSAEKVTKFQ